jgi:Ca2+-binding RTX toxin-like protein
VDLVGVGQFGLACSNQEWKMAIDYSRFYVSSKGHNELLKHHIQQTGSYLDSVLEAIMVDAGLNPAGNTARHAQTADGARAAAGLDQIIQDAIKATGVAADGDISVADVIKLNAWIRADAGRLADWKRLHGDDENGVATGFHLVQGDGGTTQFRGQNFVNTSLDGIYHLGFAIENGRFLNEDGNQNATLLDVANWLNAFALGNHDVNGTAADDVLTSGTSSAIFADFDNEIFNAGAGNDTVNAGAGNDVAYGGTGNDTLNGEAGNDKLYGEAGNDTLNGGAGNDQLFGGTGADVLNGGDGNDSLEGGDGNDKLDGGNGNDDLFGDAGNDNLAGGAGQDVLRGGAGNDVLNGGDGNDFLYGEDGDDTLIGGAGNDKLMGGAGSDVLNGGAGADYFDLGDDRAKDIIVFNAGDSSTSGQFDTVENFHHGEDKINLSSFQGMHFGAGSAFTGSGPEVIFRGENVLIDSNGDGKADMTIHFEGHVVITASDFIF